jgi:hypothetical protein
VWSGIYLKSEGTFLREALDESVRVQRRLTACVSRYPTLKWIRGRYPEQICRVLPEKVEYANAGRHTPTSSDAQRIHRRIDIHHAYGQSGRWRLRGKPLDSRIWCVILTKGDTSSREVAHLTAIGGSAGNVEVREKLLMKRGKANY